MWMPLLSMPLSILSYDFLVTKVGCGVAKFHPNQIALSLLKRLTYLMCVPACRVLVIPPKNDKSLKQKNNTGTHREQSKTYLADLLLNGCFEI